MRRIGITAILSLVAFLLAGCTSGASDSVGTAPSLPSVTTPEWSVPGTAVDGTRDGVTGDASGAEGAITREVVVQGQLSLIADDPVAASSRSSSSCWP